MLQKKLESVLTEKPDETTQNGEIFDREAYLRDVEGFEDVEVVVSGRNAVKVDRKSVRGRANNVSSQVKSIFLFEHDDPGKSRKAVLALHPALGQGLPQTTTRLDDGGLVRPDRVRFQQQSQAFADCPLSLSGMN